jgi:hypothetical protein
MQHAKGFRWATVDQCLALIQCKVLGAICKYKRCQRVFVAVDMDLERERERERDVRFGGVLVSSAACRIMCAYHSLTLHANFLAIATSSTSQPSISHSIYTCCRRATLGAIRSKICLMAAVCVGNCQNGAENVISTNALSIGFTSVYRTKACSYVRSVQPIRSDCID